MPGGNRTSDTVSPPEIIYLSPPHGFNGEQCEERQVHGGSLARRGGGCRSLGPPASPAQQGRLHHPRRAAARAVRVPQPEAAPHPTPHLWLSRPRRSAPGLSGRGDNVRGREFRTRHSLSGPAHSRSRSRSQTAPHPAPALDAPASHPRRRLPPTRGLGWDPAPPDPLRQGRGWRGRGGDAVGKGPAGGAQPLGPRAAPATPARPRKLALSAPGPRARSRPAADSPGAAARGLPPPPQRGPQEPQREGEGGEGAEPGAHVTARGGTWLVRDHRGAGRSRT
ncbi:proline-rich proteoglycan 2-like [Lutra lutra]|uniref:proline-rich proteoglycan 2-like n=1 Tax=Lutra lutra TaxID=9657 RepID=UPI001FCFAFCB|nr:proline-rich proteoglycan 2-like [Lutra lutra]